MNNTCTNMFWLPHRHYKAIFQVSDQGSTSNVFQLLAMADLKEYSKHCCASLEGIKRRFEDKDYGGTSQAVEAAKEFLSIGKKMMIRFQTLRKKPEERKQWIRDTFGGDAISKKSLNVQQSLLVSKIVSRQVPAVEASIMQVAVRAAPGVTSKESLCLTYDTSCEKFKAVVCGDNENMTKMFDTPKEAKGWLLSMGKCSEAGAQNIIYIDIYIYNTYM